MKKIMKLAVKIITIFTMVFRRPLAKLDFDVIDYRLKGQKKYLFHTHRWITVCDSGKHRYQKCKCKQRKIIDVMPGCGYQPIDFDWLEGIEDDTDCLEV